MLPDIVCFPNNVVDGIANLMDDIDPDVRVVKRPVRQTDYGLTIGVTPDTWSPDEQSKEMAGTFQEPTIQRYVVVMETLVVDMDEVRGTRQSSILSTLVRRKIYRELPSALQGTNYTVTIGGYKEKLSGKWDIGVQKFDNEQIQTNFVYLSSIQFSFDTIVSRV